MLIHNGDIMAVVSDPPINPVRIREKGSTRPTGSCYSGWLGAPEPSVTGQIGLANPVLASPILVSESYWGVFQP